MGVNVLPVWNKSHREHTIVKTSPPAVRCEADRAVQALGWQDRYYVDADHIDMRTVDLFLDSSDFFTIDVASCIGVESARGEIDDFIESVSSIDASKHLEALGAVALCQNEIYAIASKYLHAVKTAGQIYQHIMDRKRESCHIELSMDETDVPQNPIEMFFILAMVSQQEFEIDTIAPKFSGRFNKGVDYEGDLALFEREFELDLDSLELATQVFGFTKTPRLSVHSGSDKFSLYPIINRIIKKKKVGLHVKTAGTTWLEEVIGLAESDDEGLELAKGIYATALERYGELTGPYSAVIDIDRPELPSGNEVRTWTSRQFASALRHVPDCPEYNPNMRQLIHVAYKVAAEMGETYLELVMQRHAKIGVGVTENLLKRHIIPIFG